MMKLSDVDIDAELANTSDSTQTELGYQTYFKKFADFLSIKFSGNIFLDDFVLMLFRDIMSIPVFCLF